MLSNTFWIYKIRIFSTLIRYLEKKQLMHSGTIWKVVLSWLNLSRELICDCERSRNCESDYPEFFLCEGCKNCKSYEQACIWIKNESGANLKDLCQWSQEKQRPVGKEQTTPCILTRQLHWQLIKFNAEVFK